MFSSVTLAMDSKSLSLVIKLSDLPATAIQEMYISKALTEIPITEIPRASSLVMFSLDLSAAAR